MHKIKNVPPPFNVDLLLYDAEADIFYFGRRVKDQGADLMLTRESYHVGYVAGAFSDFVAVNGGVVFWKMLFKPC